MSKRKKALTAIGLIAAIFCMETGTANAEVIKTSVCGYGVVADTIISTSVATARTNCESRDAYTTVSAVFYYIDRDNMSMESMYDSHESNYCSIVKMSLPSGNNEAYEIQADHTVEYSVGSEYGFWSNSSSEKLN